MAEQRRRPGRPRSEKPKESFSVYLSEEDKLAFGRLVAKRGGKSLSDYSAGLILEHMNEGDAPEEQGIPIIGPIPAGGLADQEEYVEQRLYCNKHPKGPEYAYVHVKGDSMNKVVPDGAYALVKDRWAMSGEVIAVQFSMPDGSVQVTLKRLRVGAGGEVFLEPDSYNPEHKTIVMSPEKPEEKNVCWVKPEMAAIKGVFTGDYVVASEN